MTDQQQRVQLCPSHLFVKFIQTLLFWTMRTHILQGWLGRAYQGHEWGVYYYYSKNWWMMACTLSDSDLYCQVMRMKMVHNRIWLFNTSGGDVCLAKILYSPSSVHWLPFNQTLCHKTGMILSKVTRINITMRFKLQIWDLDDILLLFWVAWRWSG